MSIYRSQICPEQLVASIQEGDSRAEEDFCRQYRDVAIAVLRPLTEDRTLVEDIAHDALLIVLLRLRGNGIRNPDRLSSYVRQTAKFTLISWFRRKDNQTRELIDDAYLAPDQLRVEDRLIREQSSEIVRSLINDMKVPRDQEILSRSYLHDDDKTTLCAALSLPINHFDRVMSRARVRLRDIVAHQESDVLCALKEQVLN
ncbi:MAG: RNA polymerase sigma-70 factor (ECF subfamily) [Candidatus Azotimanducaceae bacterium]|jgi:RNA polymerase sigma-70 factor (ECF subfamily)